MEILATRRENTGERETLAPHVLRGYLAAEPLVPLDGPVKALAAETTRGKKGDAHRAIYEKVTGMMTYDKSGEGWGRGDAVWACNARRGNCTDFHALIVGMARSQGIPARFAMGVPLPEQRGEGEVPGYHCWAELYVGGLWVPVDSSEGARGLAAGNVARKEYFYGHHDENRLEFSRGRHITLNPPQKSGPQARHRMGSPRSTAFGASRESRGARSCGTATRRSSFTATSRSRTIRSGVRWPCGSAWTGRAP